MNTLTFLEAATVVVGSALLGPATAERPTPRQPAQLRASVVPVGASDVAGHQLSTQQRAELRRQLAEYSRTPFKVAPTKCQPSHPCP